ncbi:zinc finger MYM-type protein 4-like isoform X2 [Hippocampus comes]|uniref:zinc finger MYM-type protein 4-like isoform X2 n=1 Tax=Hippocampus comes TaxID=109280 RepID=UPI00094E6E84|nr:PREDICTED: zinc finger MYM-type protein 4-like isoform X2 [Hippocampus comes]
MADSEEFRLKRLMHEQQQSRVFDQVMGLGDFADSSQGSNTSSKSGGLEGTKAADEISGLEAPHHPDEDSSNSSSRQQEKIGEGVEESSSPRIASPVTDQRSSFTMGPSEGGGSGEAAFDDALDGLPSFGPEEEEEEDEDWHFALPAETLQDDDCDKSKCKSNQLREKHNKIQEDRSPLEPREEVEEEQEREVTSCSANTSHSSKDNTPESSRDAGTLTRMEQTEDSRQGERSEAPPVEDSNPPISPNITIKDEPIDEGYNAALQPQTTVRQIKEELDHQEEELRISSVYSVGGGNTLVPPVGNSTKMAAASHIAHQVAAPAPPQTAIFIPGRGAVLQAVTPLSVRPPAAIQTSLTSLSPLPLRPPVPTIPGSVRCSGCFKVLLKGQTAFQRKGSTQLFCSTVCLTGHLPPTTKNQLCSLCNSEILRARDTITIPADDNTYLHFCGQHCLSIFRHRTKKIEKAPEKVVEKRPEKKIDKPPEKPAERLAENVVCSVCRITNRIEHEVSHQGRLHKLCSDACFVTWRKMRQLAMNCCEGCGLYCSSSSDSYHTLTIEKSELNFCGPTCIGTYKQSCRKTVECARCQKSAIVSATIMERDDKGKVQLYCSPVCVQMSRPPLHTLTGAAFPCCLCKNVAVPQYHLAMVDGTIRNFCSFDCVSTFRKTGHAGSELNNGKSSPRDASRLGPSSRASSVPPIPQDYPSSAPYPSHHGSNSSVPPLVPPSLGLTSTSVPGQGHPRTPTALSVKPAEGGPNDGPKVTCHQCTKQFITKPLLFGHKDQISVFCSMVCCDVYKTVNNILVMCEVCRKDMVPFDTIHYNGKDIFFCSKHCKQNFKICITSRNKDPPCRPCSYCYSISQRMLHSHYGGKLEEFCKPLCMSQYTVLYYGMGRCDSCRKQGYLNEKLQYMGSVRNFCNLTCLLGYCSLNFQSTQHTPSNGTGAEQPHAPAQPHHFSKTNPVIADVVSLANGSATQPSVPSDVAMTGGLPNSSVDGKILDHASTQTDTMRGPPLYRRQMKNKSVLCRPFTMDQESLCLLLEPSTNSSDEITSNDSEKAVKKMKTDQETAPSPPSSNCSTEEEQVKMLMVPIPVPVFIPVPMNMYSQHTPVPLAMPITVPVPIVIPPQSKEVTDAAIQLDPWKEEPEKRDNVEEPMEQEVIPLDPVPVVVPPQRKDMKDVAVQSDPLEQVTEEQNQAKVASQIKDVKDVAVQSEPMDTQVPLPIVLPQSKDVKDAAVQSEPLNLEKQTDLADSKEYQVTSKVLTPICMPPLSKQALTTAVRSDVLELETAATAQSDSCDVETAAIVQTDCLATQTATPVQSDSLDVETGSTVQSDSCDVETAATVQSDRLAAQTVAPVQSDSLDLETGGNVQSDCLAAGTASPVQSDSLDMETAAPVRSDRLAVEIAVPAQSDSLDMKTPATVQSDLWNVETGTKMDLDDASKGQHKSTMSEVAPPTIHQVEESPNTAQTKIPPPVTSPRKKEASRTLRRSQAKAKPTTSENQDTIIAEQQPPSSPMTDLEFDFPMDLLDLKPATPQRGVKRPREGFSGRKRGRRRTVSKDRSAVVPPVSFSLNYMYGVKAWKNWVQLHNTHSRRSNPVIIKEEILQCDSAELSYALSCFIKEVRRPNGEAYSPDSIFYLCLGIQQYIFMKGRIENIFTDELYSQFAMEISGMLRLWKPKQLPNGSPVSSRVEESFLWECKQLGAYSPIVLLNTLLFFYTKNFHFTTLTQHQSLSFANFSLHTKPCSRAGKVLYLKYQRSSTATSSRGETERMKKRQEKEEGDMEIAENVTNPLHCPVRLYEFYLSRCPPTALKRSDMFYLQPERNVHTHSSYWYTCHTLHHTILQSMLTRILAVKEVQR